MRKLFQGVFPFTFVLSYSHFYRCLPLLHLYRYIDTLLVSSSIVGSTLHIGANPPNTYSASTNKSNFSKLQPFFPISLQTPRPAPVSPKIEVFGLAFSVVELFHHQMALLSAPAPVLIVKHSLSPEHRSFQRIHRPALYLRAPLLDPMRSMLLQLVLVCMITL
jgi:hypothetical protein